MKRQIAYMAVVLLVAMGVRAYGDYAATEGAGSTFFAFTCFASKKCTAQVPINSAGTEIMTSAAPAQVSLANTGANATAIKVDGSAATQPVSGTVTAAQATAANLNATVVGTGTFATQSTLNAETTKVIGTVRNLGNAGAITDFAGQNASSPANAWLMGGQFNTSPTTITNGNSSPLQLDNAGNLLVNIKAGAAAGGTSSNFGSAFPSAGTAIGASDGTNMQALRVTTYGTAPTGLNALGVNAFVTNANANGAATAANSAPTVQAIDQVNSTTGNIAANNTTSVVVNAAATTLYGIQVFGIGSAPAYLKLYNATSATCGSGTPVKRIMIPAAATAANGTGAVIPFSLGLRFSTGLTYCVTTGITDADTTAPAANTYLVNLDWR